MHFKEDLDSFKILFYMSRVQWEIHGDEINKSRTKHA